MGNRRTGKGRLGLYLLLSGFVLLIAVAALILGAGAGNQGSVPDINRAQWLVVGTFANSPAEDPWLVCEGFERDYLTANGGEAKARFKKGMKIGERDVIATVAKDGAVDLLGLFPNSLNTVAYAYLEVTSAKEQKVALKMGSDDGIKVWLNGNLIWANHSHRPVTPEQEAVAANLKRGANRLLVKVDQGNGGWGFSLRMRSIAAETADWAKVKAPAYQIILPNPVITEKSQAWCVVNTIPALAVPEPVKLHIYDRVGQELGSKEGMIGEPIALGIPENYEGAILLEAVGDGKESGIKSPRALGMVGDPRKVAGEAIAQARKISKEWAPSPKSEDLGATLSFLADQLEGKVDPSLTTQERNLVAVTSIYEIKQMLKQGPWQTAALRGTHQWAYRSVNDDSCQPYTVYLPGNYDPQKKYSLLMTLHGYSGNDFGAAQKLGNLGPDDFIIVGAFGRGDMGYRSFGEQDVLDVLDRVQQIYSIDPDRVYLMGESMGGMGTWRMSQFYTDRFAAVAPFCGWTGTDYLGNLRNLPILIVHGDADPTVPYFMDEVASRRLKELGYDYRFDLLAGADHGAWDAWTKVKGGGNRIFEYFRKYRRNPWPVEVNLRANYLRYGRQYWVRIKELEKPLAPGAVHAVVKGSREILVETEGIASLTLDLRHPKLEQTGSITIKIDNDPLAVSAGSEEVRLDFHKELGGWRIGFENPVAAPKGLAASSKLSPHLGGGAADLFHGPLIFVYGTQRPGRSSILKNAAETIADFRPTPENGEGSKVGRFLVKADTEVSEGELLSHNLFLVGNGYENRVTAALMAKWGKNFPVQLVGDDLRVGDREFIKSGVMFVYPNPLGPKYLAGVLTLPFSKGEIEEYTKYVNIPVRSYSINGSGIEGYILPDVVVLESLTEGSTQVWSFEQEWKELIPVN